MENLNKILIDWKNTQFRDKDKFISVSAEDITIPEYIKCITTDTFNKNKDKISEIINTIAYNIGNIKPDPGITAEWDYIDPLGNTTPRVWINSKFFIIDSEKFYIYNRILTNFYRRNINKKLILPDNYKNIYVLSSDLYVPDQLIPASDGKGWVEDDELLCRGKHRKLIDNLYKYLYTDKNIWPFHTSINSQIAPDYWAQLFAYAKPIIDDQYFIFSVELDQNGEDYDNRGYTISYYVMDYN